MCARRSGHLQPRGIAPSVHFLSYGWRRYTHPRMKLFCKTSPPRRSICRREPLPRNASVTVGVALLLRRRAIPLVGYGQNFVAQVPIDVDSFRFQTAEPPLNPTIICPSRGYCQYYLTQITQTGGNFTALRYETQVVLQLCRSGRPPLAEQIRRVFEWPVK